MSFDIHPDQLARNKMMYEASKPQKGREATFRENIEKYKAGDGLPILTDVWLETYVRKVSQWHRDRNLIDGSTDKDQALKLLQELGELSDSICKGKDISDDIGDMLVVMINIVERNNLTLTHCLQEAWMDIKDRKGKMVDGIFVKEEDLS